MGKEQLRSGMAILFGEKPASPQLEEIPTASEELIETVQDEELKEALRQRQLDGRGRPRRGRKKESKTEGYGTICVKANLDKWEKVKYISLQETLQIKEVLELALDMLIEKYESEKGTIRVRQSKKGNVFNK